MFHNRTALARLLLCVVCASASQAASLTLDPAGPLQVGPGELAGWGFTFDNSDGFAVLTFSTFAPSSATGTYTDLIVSQSIEVPPNTGFVGSFDPTQPTGIGEFQVSFAAPQGSFVSGTITLFFDLFKVSPEDDSFNPDTDTISLGNNVTADASLQVSLPAVDAPEPSAGFLAASLLIVLAMMQIARRRHAVKDV